MDVVDYISQLIKDAIHHRSSDIHIEPQAEHLRIRHRVDGFLVQIDEVDHQYAAMIISRLKVMASLDIGERRIPQDGCIAFTHEGKRLDVRISTMPTLYGEKVVLRIIQDGERDISLTELGMASTERERVEKLLMRSSGLLIVTGPTGSGKTTTMYAMLKTLNQPEVNLVTLEDPVELKLSGVNQVQIHPKAGLTFPQALRSILRQDPDIMMIGEIRDKETADIAIGAALTGHMVLSTLHTVDAPSAITRLLDMGVEAYRVAAALSGVVAQRLVRRICSLCKGKGCLDCQQTGYKERLGIFEVLASDEVFQQQMIQDSSLVSLRRFCRNRGIRSLYQVALEKVKQGDTTMKEVLRVVDDVQTQECMEDRPVGVTQ